MLTFSKEREKKREKFKGIHRANHGEKASFWAFTWKFLELHKCFM